MTTNPPAEPGQPPASGEPPAPPTPPPPAAMVDPANLPDDHPLVKAYRSTKAELAEAKRKADEAAEQARLAALDDAERKIEEAKAAAHQAGRDEALSTFGSRVAAAEIKAALTGIVPDPAAIVDDLNIARYLTDTGEVDAGKVAELKAKYQAFAKPATSGSADGGPQGAPVHEVKQLSQADLKTMTPEQIVEAKDKGQLAQLLGTSP